jgi:hypothetical protein
MNETFSQRVQAVMKTMIDDIRVIMIIGEIEGIARRTGNSAAMV